MGNVISATTRSAYGTRRGSQRETFLSSAGELLDTSRMHLESGSYDLALEYAYQAALRTAGAEVATSVSVARRKRLPSSAWDKLALTGQTGKEWAAIFAGYSRLRGRVASGIELHPAPADVEKLVDLAHEFFREVNGDAFDEPAAA